MNVILLTAVVLAATFMDSGVGSSSDGKGPIEASESRRLVSKVLGRQREDYNAAFHPIEDTKAPLFLTSSDTKAPLLMGESRVGCHSIVPCQVESKATDYATFVENHILTTCFDRNSLDEWESYLEKTGLCGRTRVQSFIDADELEVQQICCGGGWRLKGASGNKGNLCVSESKMVVYDVISSKKKICTVADVTSHYQDVVVACNKIGGRCVPVHYEAFNDPEKGYEVCM